MKTPVSLQPRRQLGRAHGLGEKTTLSKINSSGQLGTVTSSRRFKMDIADVNASSECLLSLRPVTLRYKPEIDPKGIRQWGLIAEEVNAVNPDLVVRDDKGQIQTVRYGQVNAMLLNEFLKEHRRADAKDKEIEELKRHVAELEAKAKEAGELQKRLAELEAKDKDREGRMARLENLLPPTPEQSAMKAAATATKGN